MSTTVRYNREKRNTFSLYCNIDSQGLQQQEGNSGERYSFFLISVLITKIAIETVKFYPAGRCYLIEKLDRIF